MNKLSTFLTAVACVLMLGSTARGATAIGINFVGGNGPGGVTSLPAGTSAGVVSQMNWNNAGGTGGSILAGSVTDGTGAIVPGVSVTWAANGTYTATGYSGAVGDNILMNRYLGHTMGACPTVIS